MVSSFVIPFVKTYNETYNETISYADAEALSILLAETVLNIRKLTEISLIKFNTEQAEANLRNQLPFNNIKQILER